MNGAMRFFTNRITREAENEVASKEILTGYIRARANNRQKQK